MSVRQWKDGYFGEETSAGVCCVCGGQLVVGLRIFLRQDCAGGDGIRAHGVVPLSVCDDPSIAAAGHTSSTAQRSRVGFAAGCVLSWRAAAVPDSVLWAVDHHREPRFADGGDDAGDPGGGGGGVCA